MAYDREEHKATYLAYHQKRFNYLLKEIDDFHLSRDDRILDIGRSPFTKQLAQKYCNVFTLGLDLGLTLLDKADSISTNTVPHIVFDLNDSKNRERWITPGKFNLIVFAEVIEHLAVSPYSALKFLDSLLVSGGGIVVQTPNAVSITKRMRMLVGKNPYAQFVDEGEIGAHHFREYTKAELIQSATKAGFRVRKHEFVNYFSPPSFMSRLVNNSFGIVPGFRLGQTIVLAKKDEKDASQVSLKS